MRVVVIGAGGHARVLLDTLVAMQQYEIVGLTDPDQHKWGMQLAGYPVLGSDDILSSLRDQGIDGVIIATGSNRLRVRLFEYVHNLNLKAVNAVHPHSWISPSVQLGEGVVVMAGVVINANTRIGHNVIINTGATVDHDCSINDHVHIAPGCHLSGNVQIGVGAFIGTGSSIIPEITVGSWSVVGAGSVVIRDVPASVTVVGVPAQEMY
jgi:UDP-perosamine 4-acetyltransferase